MSIPRGSVTGDNTPWLEDRGWNSEVTPSRSIVALSNNGDKQSVTMAQI